jgi:peptidoglycan/xylan/chitin deacetylase (PgdA/CDA1 family)
VPATIFVTSGKVDSQEEFWWDELERILLLSPVLPPRLELSIGDQQYAWEIADAGLLDSSASFNVLSESHPTTRQQAYLDLMKLLRDLDVEALEAVLKKLRAWTRLDTNASRQDWLAVKTDELNSLPAEGLIDIGAHTVNHPALSKLAPECQKREILESKSALEKILGRPVETFAYPFGERNDYTRQTMSIVKDAGFSCACSNFAGQVTLWSDPYQLPRLVVRDWDGDTFAHHLREWFRE